MLWKCFVLPGYAWAKERNDLCDVYIDTAAKFVRETYYCLIFTECAGGVFGQDWTERCGKCVGKEPCHHIYGICMNGCDPGYETINCTKGNLICNIYILMHT